MRGVGPGEIWINEHLGEWTLFAITAVDGANIWYVVVASHAGDIGEKGWFHASSSWASNCRKLS